MDLSLGKKIDNNRCGPQFVPDQRVRREGHLEGMKRSSNARHLDG